MYAVEAVCGSSGGRSHTTTSHHHCYQCALGHYLQRLLGTTPTISATSITHNYLLQHHCFLPLIMRLPLHRYVRTCLPLIMQLLQLQHTTMYNSIAFSAPALSSVTATAQATRVGPIQKTVVLACPPLDSVVLACPPLHTGAGCPPLAQSQWRFGRPTLCSTLPCPRAVCPRCRLARPPSLRRCTGASSSH